MVVKCRVQSYNFKQVLKTIFTLKVPTCLVLALGIGTWYWHVSRVVCTYRHEKAPTFTTMSMEHCQDSLAGGTVEAYVERVRLK